MSLPNPGPIATLAAKQAEVNVGVTESGGNNRGRWVEIYLKSVNAQPGDPWCGAFVAYREKDAASILEASIPDGFPLSAWTPDYKVWALAHGLWMPANQWAKSQRGDLACYYFEGKGRIAHIGIVTAGSANPFTDVEGNTSKPASMMGGNDRDGDGVWKKIRSYANLGEFGGFCRLPF